MVEGMLVCESVGELMQWFKSAILNHGELIEQRKKWREDVNAAEAEIAAEEAAIAAATENNE